MLAVQVTSENSRNTSTFNTLRIIISETSALEIPEQLSSPVFVMRKI